MNDRDPWGTVEDPISGDEAVRLANEGARRVFCVRCERGHEGACTGPETEFTQVNRPPIDPIDDAVTAAEAARAVEHARAIQAEHRAAYLAGTPDEHHPNL